MQINELKMLVPEVRGLEIMKGGVREARTVFPSGVVLIGIKGARRQVLEEYDKVVVLGAPEDYFGLGYDTLVAIFDGKALVWNN